MSSCQFCEKIGPSYVCPRCSVVYCSLTCYKHATHRRCTESFYRDCVEEELSVKDSKSRSFSSQLPHHPTSEGNDEFYNGDGCLDDETATEEAFPLGELVQELQHIDWARLSESQLDAELAELGLDPADTEQLLVTLSDDQRAQLDWLAANESKWSADNTGTAAKPWYATFERPVMEASAADALLRDLPDLSSLKLVLEECSTKLPETLSPNVSYDLLQVLAIYCLLYRSIGTVPAEMLLELCEVLRPGASFPDAALAVQTAWRNCDFGVEQKKEILKDVETLLTKSQNGTSFVLYALSDLHNILKTDAKRLKNIDRKNWFLARKKIEFFTLWFLAQSKTGNESTWTRVLSEVSALAGALVAENQTHESLRLQVEKGVKKRCKD